MKIWCGREYWKRELRNWSKKRHIWAKIGTTRNFLRLPCPLALYLASLALGSNETIVCHTPIFSYWAKPNILSLWTLLNLNETYDTRKIPKSGWVMQWHSGFAVRFWDDPLEKCKDDHLGKSAAQPYCTTSPRKHSSQWQLKISQARTKNSCTMHNASPYLLGTMHLNFDIK